MASDAKKLFLARRIGVTGSVPNVPRDISEVFCAAVGWRIIGRDAVLVTRGGMRKAAKQEAKQPRTRG